MTIRAIYTVTNDEGGNARVLLLGDHQVTPTRLDGMDRTDALGKRQTQYDELIEVDLDTLNDEITRRVDLALQLTWQGGE